MAGEPMGADLGEVLVIIPTYNEAENIETVTSRLRTANPQVHVLIADDNSPDGTGEIADRLAGADEHVHVMHRKGKEGLGAAHLAGFDWGLSHDYGVLVEMDADLSHQPEQLPALLSALQHADMVKGSRYVSGGSVVNWPKSREFISRGGGTWTRLMLGIDVKDPTGGFNAFRASTLRTINLATVDSAGYCFQLDMTWRVLKAGGVVAEVPITFVERERGASKMSKDIVVEAMAQTTRWGVEHRAKQVSHVADKLAGKASEVIKQFRR